jgi:hypothetical protein
MLLLAVALQNLVVEKMDIMQEKCDEMGLTVVELEKYHGLKQLPDLLIVITF